MLLSKLPRLKPTLVDYVRAVGYLAFTAWSVVFLVYPPVAFVSSLDFWTRVTWMSIVFAASVLAFWGAILRVDLKMELPALLFLTLGPFFYSFSQLYYVFFPLAGADPSQRYALVIYGIIPLLLLLPRTVELLIEVRRQKRVNSL